VEKEIPDAKFHFLFNVFKLNAVELLRRAHHVRHVNVPANIPATAP